MPHIQQLDAHMSDLIAAGEVVERPASVVKELVENAIDAGSSAVIVELRRGGMELIRVTDNGCGIAAHELPVAFLRHATSKLRTPEDLSRIGTLGFRGEALAAISAVSRLEILSRQPDQNTGASLSLEGGIPGQIQEAGAPVGTTVIVQDLFFNTPARLKFMKKDSAEAAAVNGLIQHLALSRPDISFRLIKDGTELLHTPGDGNLLSAVYSTLGRDFARTLIPIDGRGGDIAVSGFITEPLYSRGSRTMQVMFVNNRFIKSQLLTTALEEGYRNQMMKGKFPGCVLSVTLPVQSVDVNVHPAKTVVKFSKEKEVFDAVYYTVLDHLDKKQNPSRNPAEASDPQQVWNPRQDFFQTMDAAAYRERSQASGHAMTTGRPSWESRRNKSQGAAAGRIFDNLPHADAAGFASRAVAVNAEDFEDGSPKPPLEELLPPDDSPADPSSAAAGHTGGKKKTAKKTVSSKLKAEPEQTTLAGTDEDTPPPWRIVGEFLRTYIACESDDGSVWLIDKHAAHERINFDRLMESQEPPMSQTLLQPVAVEPDGEDCALLLENQEQLTALGFTIEEFGMGALLVRAVPADMDVGAIPAALEELAETLRSGRSPDERREAMLRTVACKASIKGGWVTDVEELRLLVEKVESGDVRYCPHGRPVAVRLTERDFEKMFKRA